MTVDIRTPPKKPRLPRRRPTDRFITDWPTVAFTADDVRQRCVEKHSVGGIGVIMGKYEYGA